MMSEKIQVSEGYKKTEVGIIPEDWSISSLEELCEILDNRRLPVTKSKRETGNVPYYGATGIVDYVKDYIFDEELILIGEDGADWSSFANTAYIIRGKSWVNNHAHVLRCSKINSIFFKEFINMSDLDVYINGTTRGKLNQASLRKIKIPVPSLHEQQKIASILSKVDKQIEQTEQIIEKTELLKKGLMQKIFVYGTENQKLQEIDVKYSPNKWIIPENWTTKLFNEITFQITDGTHFTPKYTDKGVPFLRVTDIQSDYIDWDSVKYISEEEHKELIKRCKPEKGNVLLSKNGTIGIPKIIDWDKEFSIFVSLCLIKVNTDIMGVSYLYHLLKSDLIRNQYALRAKTGTVTNLHLEEIRELTIPIPPLEEQVKISHIMYSFDTELKYENNYLTKLQELKKGLMQDLLTGKVRVCV